MVAVSKTLWTSLSVYSPITANHLFPASLLDNTFTLWLRNGVLNIKMLYKDGVLIKTESRVSCKVYKATFGVRVRLCKTKHLLHLLYLAQLQSP